MIGFFKKRRLRHRTMRPMLLKDARELSTLHGRSFPRRWAVSEFEDLLAQPANVCWGMVLREKVIAFLLLRFAADEAEVLTLAVDPSFRRCGLAEHMMRHGLNQAKIAGARACHLEVEAANRAALRLYEKLGFAETGRRRGYYVSSGDADAVVMTVSL